MNTVSQCDFNYGSYSLYLMNEVTSPTVYGRVDLHVTHRDFFIRGIWVKLKGTKTIFESHKEIDLLQNDEDNDLYYYLDGYHIVFIGLGEGEEENSVVIPLAVDSDHSWSFSFNLPKGYPLSYCDNNFQIIYTVSVVVDSPNIPIAVSSVSHVIVIDKLLDSNLQDQIKTRNR